MSDHSGVPEGWLSLSVAILWVIFAFAFGFEAVVNFNDWLLGHGPSYAVVAGIDALLCVFIAVIALVLWRGRILLPAGFVASANRAAGSASVWTAVLIVLLVVLGLPHFITHVGFTFVSPGQEEVNNSITENPPEDVLKLVAALRTRLDSGYTDG